MITVTNLIKNHGSLRVLDGVSFSLQRGEVAVIVGPSGGGKSTLLRCINGLEPFQEGEVRVGEIVLRSTPPSSETLLNLRRRIGMVFQQFHLFPHLNVLENIMSGPLWALRRTRAEVEPEAQKLLERVGLADKANHRPDQLSGGQQQRVAIARALAVKPEAILFDEPTSALDPVMAREVLRVIADLAELGQTMVVVTHAMEFARELADVVHVMAQGKVVESGPPSVVFENPQHVTTSEFLQRKLN